MKRFRLSLSEAHVNYLEHQAGRRLGSSSTSDIRDLVELLLGGRLPKRRPQKQFAQSGHTFAVYNQKRQRIDFFLRPGHAAKVERLSVLEGAASIPPLEILVEEHARHLGYKIENHTCNHWCRAPEGTAPTCPGEILRISREANSRKRVG